MANYQRQHRVLANTSASAKINVAAGVAPSSPVDGDVWRVGNCFYAHINGATVRFVMSNEKRADWTNGWLASYFENAGVVSGGVNSAVSLNLIGDEALDAARISTGITSSAGAAQLREPIGIRRLQSGLILEIEYRVKLNILSDVTNWYECELGVTQATNANGITTSGCIFSYDPNMFGANWHCVNINASVSTEVDSGVAVSTTNWTKLRMVINGLTNVTYYINDVQVAQISFNMPTADMHQRLRMLKRSGTSARHVTVSHATTLRSA